MKLFFAAISLFFAVNIFAQRCASADYALKHPVSRYALRGANINEASRDTLSNEVITVPVVVHVVYNNSAENISDAQIRSQIVALNNDYRRQNADTGKTPAPFKALAADTRIQFCLAKTDPDGKYTSGIIRTYTKVSEFSTDDAVKFATKGGDNAWDASRYLNIWICNLTGRTLGYTVPPGSPADKDGVVIRYSAFGTTGNVASPYNKGRTATHEVGHWLGLAHLWGDAQCGDDHIADTPPQETANNNCPSFPHLSACSTSPYGDMFMNYMDFTNDACMNMFTQGQKREMRALFAKGNLRNSFLNSTACDSSNAEGAPLPKLSPQLFEIKIYPNPVRQTIYITASDDTTLLGAVVRLYNLDGKLISTSKIQGQSTTVAVSNLAAGFYILKIQNANSSYVYKVVKQ